MCPNWACVRYDVCHRHVWPEELQPRSFATLSLSLTLTHTTMSSGKTAEVCTADTNHAGATAHLTPTQDSTWKTREQASENQYARSKVRTRSDVIPISSP